MRRGGGRHEVGAALAGPQQLDQSPAAGHVLGEPVGGRVVDEVGVLIVDDVEFGEVLRGGHSRVAHDRVEAGVDEPAEQGRHLHGVEALEVVGHPALGRGVQAIGEHEHAVGDLARGEQVRAALLEERAPAGHHVVACGLAAVGGERGQIVILRVVEVEAVAHHVEAAALEAAADRAREQLVGGLGRDFRVAEDRVGVKPALELRGVAEVLRPGGEVAEVVVQAGEIVGLERLVLEMTVGGELFGVEVEAGDADRVLGRAVVYQHVAQRQVVEEQGER